jgi:hypothetical protein
MRKIWNLKNLTFLLNHKIAKRAKMSFKTNKVKKRKRYKKLQQKNCRKLSLSLSKNHTQRKYWAYKIIEIIWSLQIN